LDHVWGAGQLIFGILPGEKLMPAERPQSDRRVNQKPAQSRIFRYTLLGLVFVSLTAVAILLVRRQPVPSLSAARLAADPALGNASARVTIVEYGDFGCPTCRGWERAGVRRQLIQAYGDKVYFVWRDFPVITAQSPKAAEAGQCAFDQGKFWEYHDLMYQRAPALSSPDLKAYAAELGLDAAKFNRCLDSGQDAPKVDQSLQQARALGFGGTPSFVINGQKLAGPASFETFKKIIDAAMAEGG
jgi:protein-disulfide isomerase